VAWVGGEGDGLVVAGTSKTVPGRMRLGNGRAGLAASQSGQREPLPRCWRASFQRESPGCTVMRALLVMRVVGRGAVSGCALSGTGAGFRCASVEAEGRAATTAGDEVAGSIGRGRKSDGVGRGGTTRCGREKGSRLPREAAVDEGVGFNGCVGCSSGFAGTARGRGAASAGCESSAGSDKRGGILSACSASRAAFSRR